MFKCHCRACQRFTGSAFLAGMVVPGESFALVQGEPVYFLSHGDSGNEIRRGFCGNCGSPVVTRLARMPQSIGVAASSLDDPSLFKPTMNIFAACAQPWDPLEPDLRQFAAGPTRG